MIQIQIENKVEYYPVIVNNTFEAKINCNTNKITWEGNLFSNIEDLYSTTEVKDIEEKIFKLFNIIINEK